MSEYEVCGYIILKFRKTSITRFRSSHPEVFLGKSVLKICSKFIGEHPCRSAISIKLQSNFIEIALRHGCSPVSLLHIFRTRFSQNASRGLSLKVICDIVKGCIILRLAYCGTEICSDSLSTQIVTIRNFVFV